MAPKACLERISPELLISIMKALPDLGSLSSLLLALPNAYRIFSSHAAGAFEVFEACLSGGLLHSHTCALIRIASQVRSGTLPSHVSDWRSLVALLRFETTTWRYYTPEWEYPASCVPSCTSASTLRKLLATYRKIERLTDLFLEFYLQRFRLFNPRHVADKSFKFLSTSYGQPPDCVVVPSWQLKPVEVPVVKRDVGASSWVEEQRVIRAFWRVQLHHDLQIAAEEGGIHWPEEKLTMLKNRGVVDLYWVDVWGVEGEYEADFMVDDNFIDPYPDNDPYLKDQMTVLEHELILSVVDYVDANQSDVQVATSSHSRPKGGQKQLHVPTPLEWHEAGHRTSETYRLFYDVGGCPDGFEYRGRVSPIQGVLFDPFRRLGFAIWSTERMVRYGSPKPESKWDNINDFFAAWRSVLTEVEIAALEQSSYKMYMDEYAENKNSPRVILDGEVWRHDKDGTDDIV